MGYEPPARDQGQVNFIQNVASQGTEPVEKTYQESNRALTDSSGLLPTLENANRQESALGRNNQAQTQAILSKGESLFSANSKKMLMKNRLEEERAKMGARERSFNLTGRELSFFREIEKQRRLAAQQEAATRNSVIRGVLSAAGTVVGVVVGGAPGAMIGSQAGNLVGGADTPSGGNDAPGSNMSETNDRMWANNSYKGGEFA